MKGRASELIDFTILRPLIEGFSRVSGLPTSILDREGNILFSTGFQDICTLYHHGNRCSFPFCMGSNALFGTAFEKGDLPAAGEHFESRCPNNLVNIGIPVLVDGQPLATLFISQFLYEPPDRERLRRMAQELGIDEEAYLDAAKRVPVFSRARVLELLEVFSGLVRLLARMGGERLRQMEARERLESSEAALEFQVRLEHLVAAMSTLFVNLPSEEVDEAITEALREIGEFVGVDRCYVFQFSGDGLAMSNTHEWCAEGVSPQRYRLQELPTDSFPWFFPQIKARQICYCPSVDDLGPEAWIEKAEWQLEGIRSLVCVPMVFKEKVPGFVGFDSVRNSKEWPEEILLLLEIIGTCFAGALERRRTDRMKEEFISTAAHELATPLTTVKGFLELLLQDEGQFSTEERREYLALALEKSEVLEQIINDLLDLSRIQSGHLIRLKKFREDLVALVAHAISIFKGDSDKHTFVMDFPSSPVGLDLDPGKISQVLTNLLSNALKFSPAGGIIRVSGNRHGGEFQVTVEDEGIGMTPEQTERIFDKFYRADSSNTAVSGLGIGMSIVRNIVVAHGGRIWVESAPGRGTRMHFTLPFQEDR